MPGQATVKVNDKQWSVSVANTLAELTSGLSGVESIPSQTGVLFDLGYDQKYIEIDMSRMLFALDIIFINSTQGVRGVMTNVQPGETDVRFEATTTPGARCFLEVNAGEAEGIEVGDNVAIQGLASQNAGLDLTGLMNFMVIMVVVVMMFKMVDRALAPPKERPKMLYPGKIPPGYKPIHSSQGSSPGQEKITKEEWEFAETMWQSTRELAEKKDPYGTHIWRMIEASYPGDKDKQIRLLGFMNEIYGRYGKGPIPHEELMRSARKWDVERFVWEEVIRIFPVSIYPEEHHSMWLTPEQRKELEEKYGAVTVRWAEEATRPGDIKGAEAAAEYYYGKLKEVFGLGHLSPELTEEQLRKLREFLGLPADVAEVLKIHQETGYIP